MLGKMAKFTSPLIIIFHPLISPSFIYNCETKLKNIALPSRTPRFLNAEERERMIEESTVAETAAREILIARN